MERSTIYKRDQVPVGAQLSAWSSREWSDGVQIGEMPDLETLTVQTQNSIYEITVLSGKTGEVLVRRGQFFPEWTPAQLAGASLGGSFLKAGGIYPGFKIEFRHDDRLIITSLVRRIISERRDP